jgi:hypothetical protein
MYKGRVHDIFLQPDGTISYIVLKNSYKYYMSFESTGLVASSQLELFGSRQSRRPQNVWDRLLVEGKNIANVLFDSSPEITRQAEGEAALESAFADAVQKTIATRRSTVTQSSKGQ